MPRYISTDLKNRLHQKLRTPSNNSDPKLEVIIARARYSVTDTSQFQVDTIREKVGLGDLGVDLKREDINEYPTDIYEVHNDNGSIITATRKLPAVPDNEWVTGATIDTGTLCRLCFNGDWRWSERKGKYLFETEGDPFIFFTDASDNLQVQTWESDTDREQLATGVTVSMDCIRGWREPDSTGNDQGIIVAYIKTGGLLYYRQYLYNGTSEVYEWQSETALTLTGITDAFAKVALFRTTDYRLGFCITTDADEVYWAITDRNWAGLAIRPETLEIGLTDYIITRTLITFVDGYEEEALEIGLTNYNIEKLFGGDLLMESAENIDNGSGDYGYKIEITMNDQAFNVTGQHAKFSVQDEDTNSYPPTAVEVKTGTNNRVIILTCTDFNAAYGKDITITYTQASGGITGEAGQDMETQDITFTPTDLVAPVTDPPAYASAENIEGESLDE